MIEVMLGQSYQTGRLWKVICYNEPYMIEGKPENNALLGDLPHEGVRQGQYGNEEETNQPEEAGELLASSSSVQYRRSNDGTHVANSGRKSEGDHDMSSESHAHGQDHSEHTAHWRIVAASMALQSVTRRVGYRADRDRDSSDVNDTPLRAAQLSRAGGEFGWLARAAGSLATHLVGRFSRGELGSEAAGAHRDTEPTAGRHLQAGVINHYGDGRLTGEIALLGSGEYVQAERGPGGITLIWTAEASAVDAIEAYLDLIGSPGWARGSVTFAEAGDHRTASVKRVIQLARGSSRAVRVLSLNHDGVQFAWRASVKKLPGGTPKNECAVTFRGGHVSSLDRLLERTGTDYVVKAASDLLPNLDLLESVR